MDKDHTSQIARIKAKLKSAKLADPERKVFGAGSHHYYIGPVVDEATVTAFEEEYGIALPSCYRAFVTQVGNGGESYSNSAAGPFYGIFPFGENPNEFSEEPKNYLYRPTLLYPKMSSEYWGKLIQPIEQEDVPDEDYERLMGELYAGILPIGSQGCSCLHGLVVSGENKGKVVNLDLDRNQPLFAYEANFLDWYERWLDEVISGELLKNSPSWFGYSMGGTQEELISSYLHADTVDHKIDCLNGLLSKPELGPATAQFAQSECTNNHPALSMLALKLLTKANYGLAKPFLVTKSSTDPVTVVKYVFWYAKTAAEDWVPLLRNLLSDPTIDPEAFRFVTYVANECTTDLTEDVLPFAQHENEQIRNQANYALANLKRKAAAVQNKNAASNVIGGGTPRPSGFWSKVKKWLDN